MLLQDPSQHPTSPSVFDPLSRLLPREQAVVGLSVLQVYCNSTQSLLKDSVLAHFILHGIVPVLVAIPAYQRQLSMAKRHLISLSKDESECYTPSSSSGDTVD